MSKKLSIINIIIFAVIGFFMMLAGAFLIRMDVEHIGSIIGLALLLFGAFIFGWHINNLTKIKGTVTFKTKKW